MGSTAKQRKREAAQNVRDAEIAVVVAAMAWEQTDASVSASDPRCAAKMVEAMRRGRLLREAVCNLRKAREEARNG